MDRYYIVYVFEGAGLTGRRGNLIASSVQYVLNVAMTGMLLACRDRSRPLMFVIVPAIIYIDKWGRRPLLLIGTLLMGFWLFLVGGLQGRMGHWGLVSTDREPCHPVQQINHLPLFYLQVFGSLLITKPRRRASLSVRTSSFVHSL
jgi:MFS family permease